MPIIIAAALAAAPTSARPIHLDVHNVDGQLVVAVVGLSPTQISAHYALEVTGGTSGAANRSSQRGRANLQPGRAVTLATTRLNNSRAATWTVRLHVTTANGEAYDVEWHSPR